MSYHDKDKIDLQNPFEFKSFSIEDTSMFQERAKKMKIKEIISEISIMPNTVQAGMLEQGDGIIKKSDLEKLKALLS